MRYASLIFLVILVLTGCMKDTTETPEDSADLTVTTEQVEEETPDSELPDIKEVEKEIVEVSRRSDSIDDQIEELRREIKNAEIVRIGNEIRITFNSQILFDVDSDQIDPSAESSLNELAKVLNKYQGTLIEVSGHTDNSGSKTYNESLSKRRAATVARYTVKKGVNPLRFRIKGHGENLPIASNSTEEGRSMNRRVEISIKANKEFNRNIAGAYKDMKDSSCFCIYDDYKNYICRRLCDSWIKLPSTALSFKSDFFDSPAKVDELFASTTKENGDKLYIIGGGDHYVRQNIGKKLEDNNAIIMVGKVKDISNNEPTGAKIKVTLLSTGEKVAEIESDRLSGGYSILLERGKHYSISVEKDGYLLSTDNISIPEMQGYTVIKQNMHLTPIQKGQKMNLKNVFFEQSKAVLLESSYVQLNEVLRLMKSNPTLKVELHGHTDGVGDPDLNYRLSEERVETIKEYLLENGVENSRVSTKAFGGTRPVTSNESEDTRKLNRRVEFLIIDI